MSSVLTTETIKERQQKAKDQREVRRMCMTAAHKYIIKLVANHIGLDQGAVEEFILDSERHMQLFSSFLDKDGVRSLKFYYQESVMPSIDGKLSLYLILSYSNNSDLMMPNLIDDEKCQMLCEEITKYRVVHFF